MADCRMRMARPESGTTECELTAARNDVYLGKNTGSITNVETGRRITLSKEGGVYILNMWVLDPETNRARAADFPRPGK